LFVNKQKFEETTSCNAWGLAGDTHFFQTIGVSCMISMLKSPNHCARIPVSSDDDTVTAFPCTECARSNLQTGELKLLITDSITTNIAELKSRSLLNLESGPNPR
jgi:hypothetical protein